MGPLRHLQQSVEPVPHARRLLRRIGGGARRGADRVGRWLGYRRLDPQPGALLRGLRPQADLGDRLGPRPGVAGKPRPHRHRCRRPPGPVGGGPEAGLLAGADGPAARAWRLTLPGPRRQSLQEYRVGVLLNDLQAEVEQSYQDAIAELASWLEGEGATVVIGAKPDFLTGEALEVYTMLLRAATSKRLSDELISQAREDLSRLPSDAIPYRRRMLKAQTMLHRDWLRWNERRYELMVGWEEWFETYDLLLCPAASSPAFPHDQAGERHDRTITVNGRAQPVVDQLFWAGYPCGYYLPSTVAPIGLALGLPVGIQIVGRQYDDLTCLHMAGLIEEGYYRFTPPPGY